MKQTSVRTTLEIPAPLYRQLRDEAAVSGRSIQELLLAAAQIVVMQGHPRPKRERFPRDTAESSKVDRTKRGDS
jgi:hypothetical protein